MDAAIATGLAAGCAQPFASGIGGGGFAVVWQAAERRAYALDARETAPLEISTALFAGPDGRPDRTLIKDGPRSVAVPSLVLGFGELHARFGRLPWAQVVMPAAALCSRGVRISDHHSGIHTRVLAFLRRNAETARIQLADGKPREIGTLLRQPELGHTYERIANEGPDAMRSGPLVDAMVQAVRAQGGVLSKQDFEAYRPLWREPARGSYRGVEVISMPPPSSGGVHIVQMLQMLEHFDLERSGLDTAQTVHTLGEAMKLAFADRARFLGDPGFIDVPVERLASRSYARQLARRMAPPFWTQLPWHWGKHTILKVDLPTVMPSGDSGTAHISVLDGEGNAVSLTQTVNTHYGSGITAPETGIILNNEMDDFALAAGLPNDHRLVGSSANEIRPGKRPLSSMSPTIVLRDGEVEMVLGSTSGPHAITSVLQIILNVIDWKMSLQAAVEAPRMHHQWFPDEIQFERGYSDALIDDVNRMGHSILRAGWKFGAGTAILRNAVGRIETGLDPRFDVEAAFPDRE